MTDSILECPAFPDIVEPEGDNKSWIPFYNQLNQLWLRIEAAESIFDAISELWEQSDESVHYLKPGKDDPAWFPFTEAKANAGAVMLKANHDYVVKAKLWVQACRELEASKGHWTFDACLIIASLS